MEPEAEALLTAAKAALAAKAWIMELPTRASKTAWMHDEFPNPFSLPGPMPGKRRYKRTVE